MADPAPTRLVLLRHAQSQWNLENRFTGWVDSDLSEAGIAEAHHAGRLLKQHGYKFDLAFTSRLVRATRTLDIVLDELGQPDIPIEGSWRLNERHYGALTGLNKKETADKYGAEQLRLWRRGYKIRPPALASDDPRHPSFDPNFADLPPEQLPATESLEDTYKRVMPYWHEHIAPRVAEGKTILISAHGNSLRALVKYLDNISDHDVEKLEIPTGKPLVYEFGPGMKVRRRYYLEDGAHAAGEADGAR